MLRILQPGTGAPSARRAYENATAALAAIASDEDRTIVMKTFSKVPRP